MTIVTSRLVPGSNIGLRLVMTKFGSPGVRIAYAIRIVPLPG